MNEPPPRDFSAYVQAAVDDLPDDPRDAMSNVAMVVEDKPPAALPLLGLEQGVPLTGKDVELRGGAVAGRLFISPKTVGGHIQRVLTKLGVHSRAQAVALTHEHGLVDVEGHGGLTLRAV